MGQVFQWIQLIIVVASLSFTVYFSWRTLREAKRLNTMSVLDRFAEQSSVASAAVSALFSAKEWESPPLPSETVEERFRTEIGRRAIVTYLNLYERLAHGVMLGAYDSAVVKLSRRRAVVLAHKRFERFISIRHEAGLDIWRHLSILAPQWSVPQKDRIAFPSSGAETK